VTGFHRLPIIAMAALLAAGCGASPASPSVAASTVAAASTPESSPAATAAPVPSTPADTSGPDPACESLGLAITPTFSPGAIDAYLGPKHQHIALSTERAASVSDPGVVWPGGYDYGDGLPDVIYLRGGGEVAINLELDYDFEFDWPLQVTEISAVLRIPGEGRQTLTTRIVESTDPAGTVIVTLPDLTARGTLTLEVEASDRCLTYASIGVGQVQIGRAALVDSCPTGHKGFAAHWVEAANPPITAGGAPLALSPSSTLGLWSTYAVSAQGNIGFAHWDPTSATASGAAGETPRVDDENADLTLESLGTDFYLRKDIVGYLEGGDWPGLDRVMFRSTADPYPDGHFELLLPSKPGRYVASFSFNYQAPCSYGDGVGVVAIDVE
jgi:hypothetical protein